MNYKKIAISSIILLMVCAFAVAAVSSAESASDTNKDNYTLQINTSGKWRLDLTVNGNYTSDEGVGSKTIELNTTVESASVTVNQYENGPTNVTLLKGKEVLKEGKSSSKDIETIYFYYQAQK